MDEERLTKFVGAYVTKTMAQELEEYAKLADTTKSEMIRHALELWLHGWSLPLEQGDKEV